MSPERTLLTLACEMDIFDTEFWYRNPLPAVVKWRFLKELISVKVLLVSSHEWQSAIKRPK